MNKGQRLGLLNVGIINEAVTALYKTQTLTKHVYDFCIYTLRIRLLNPCKFEEKD